MSLRYGVAIVLVAGAISCGQAAQQSPGGNADRPIPVRSVRVVGEPLTVTVTEVGTVEPEKRIVVSSQVEGVITALNVREGDIVERGDALLALDDRELTAQLDEARARLVEAQAQWNRASRLAADGLVTEAEADSARAAHEVAQARVDALHTRLSFTRVQAPAAGVITARYVELGDVVGARSALLELASGRLVLRVPVSELEVVRLAVDDAASVTVDALPEVAIAARILRIFPAADRTSRQVTVELVLDRPPAALRPGFLARAELTVQKISGALMVPELAVQRGSEVGSFVYVLTGDIARVRPVEVGIRQGGRAQIVEGLAPGDEMVVEGAPLLRDGAAVTRYGGEDQR